MVAIELSLFSGSSFIVIAGWTNPIPQLGLEQKRRPSTTCQPQLNRALDSCENSWPSMFSLRLCSKKPFTPFTSLSSPSGLINRQNLVRARHLQPIESRCLFRRCYAQLPKKPISKPNFSAAEQAKQQAKQQAKVAAANVGSKHYGNHPD